MNWVLDTSVAARWLLEDAGAGQLYAMGALHDLEARDAQALVPSIWGLDLASVMLKAERQGVLTDERAARFLRMLSALPIEADGRTAHHALTTTLQLARQYRLSSYDAAYLELAQRLSLPLATLDEALRRAARKAGVKLFKPGRA